jgi:hypothetical protein
MLIVLDNAESILDPRGPAKAAHDTFYRIYKHSGQPDPIDNILKQLDFNPLSITLFTTTAQHNERVTGRLTMELEKQQTGVLRIQHSGSLAATIGLSLVSPTFRELGPDARPLLEVIARQIPRSLPGISNRRVHPTTRPPTSNGSRVVFAPQDDQGKLLRSQGCRGEPRLTTAWRSTVDHGRG